jgi:hypothetical protein
MANKTLDENIEVEIIHEKLLDAFTPGYSVEFDPEEAENSGAFKEDAIDEKDALESNIDLLAETAIEEGELNNG